MDVIIIGLLLGGTYALMAMGLHLQYGVARIMNLANGEILVAGAFTTFWFFTATRFSPFWSLVGIVPLAFAVNWLGYRILILPLVRRGKRHGHLEDGTILAAVGVRGGVGDVRGAVFASFILGIAETAVAILVDPGLTLAAAYVLFLVTLLVRPQGLFGRRPT